MKQWLSVLACLIVSSSSFAHPKVMGRVSGENVDMKTIQHSFAGSIGDRIVMGHKKPGQFVSELRILEGDKEFVSEFRHDANRVFGGEFYTYKQGQLVSHRVEFVELIQEDQKYVMKFGEELVNVYVSAEDFRDGHFINPEYTMDFQGQSYSFRLEGQACYGYSLHLISMIMSALIF